MAQILIVADSPNEAHESTIVYRERVASTDLESSHFSGQLVERVGWAVRDADLLEHENRPPLTASPKMSRLDGPSGARVGH